MIPRYLLILASALVAFFVTPPAHADRVKDLASLAAARSNQLVGFGIVVGLQGTGDGAAVPITTQTVRAKAFPEPDSDGDGLSDVQELRFGSDPFVMDTDGDGANDLAEFTANFLPSRNH